jgi:putative addiction module component (TIGR02574 family)
MVDFNSVLTAARQLTEEDQLRLVDALGLHPNDKFDPPFDEFWKIELERRVARIESGESKSIPWETVRAETRRRLGLPEND